MKLEKGSRYRFQGLVQVPNVVPFGNLPSSLYPPPGAYYTKIAAQVALPRLVHLLEKQNSWHRSIRLKASAEVMSVALFKLGQAASVAAGEVFLLKNLDEMFIDLYIEEELDGKS